MTENVFEKELHERIRCQNCNCDLMVKSPSFDYWNLQCPSCRTAIWLPKKVKSYIQINERKQRDLYT